MTMQSGYFRLTRDVPTLGGEWKAGDVVVVRSMTLQGRRGNLCALTDLSIIEPMDQDAARAALSAQRSQSPPMMPPPATASPAPRRRRDQAARGPIGVVVRLAMQHRKGFAMSQKCRPSIPERGKRCYRCGCDNEHACVDAELTPCHWISPTLCSHCYDCVEAFRPGMVVYQTMLGSDAFTVCARQLVMDRTGRSPRITGESQRSLVERPDLVTHPKDTIFDRVAASLLADCLGDDARAAELAPLLAFEMVQSGSDPWIINEFQVRRFAAENVIPY